MSRSAWEDRRKGLEEEFFAKENRALMDKLKAKSAQEEGIKHLSQASGIRDQQILESLYKADITAADLAALSLAPLVLVAWADGNIDARERKAIDQAIRESGIDEAQIAYKLLMNWLVDPPEDSLLETWKQYMHGLENVMNKHDFTQLKSRIVQRAQDVAEAAGGFMGLGDRVSESEQKILDKLRA